jgi:endonuclease/exonuclease/phosphatase family metal-dependent hydrolase
MTPRTNTCMIRGLRLVIASILALSAILHARHLPAQTTGTFIDRQLPTDLRVVSYNIWQDSIFSDTHSSRPAKFARVMQALRPDVIALQEIYNHDASNVAQLMDSILPLGGGAHWNAHRSADNVIVSKYPLELLAYSTQPSALQNMAIALVNLPDSQFATDFYVMNNHYKCCGGFDYSRQIQSDALVNWMRDARQAGGYVDLPGDTPMAVMGDLNIVDTLDPLDNLIAGNIVNEATYGADSPPDWDVSPLADAHPVHNGVGTTDYTWRNNNGGFPPGRLDFVLYTDSALGIANRFVLNAAAMTTAQRNATGLQQLDTAITSNNYDHLPVVVDFRFPIPGDYNGDRTVNHLDFQLWRSTFGSTQNLSADGNGNQVVDAGDYVIWRRHLTIGSGAVAGPDIAVPEPASNLLLVMAFVVSAAVPLRKVALTTLLPGKSSERDRHG